MPYGFGIVELEAEALRVVGRLTEPDPARLAAGQPMRVVVERLPGDLDMWAFAPEAAPHDDRRRDRRRRAAPVRPLRGRDRHVDGRGRAAGPPSTTPAGAWPTPGRRSAPRSARRPTAGWPPGTACSVAWPSPACRSSTWRPGCASGGAALSLAAQRDPVGRARRGDRRRHREDAQGDHPLVVLRAVAGAGRPRRDARLLRAAGAAHDADHGLTKDDLAALVVKNRAWGEHNPNAMFRARGHRRAGARVAGRLRAAPPLDAVLAERGRGRGRAAPGRGDPAACGSAAVALRSHLPGNVLDESTPMAGLVDDAGITPPTTLAAARRVRGGRRRSRRPRRGRVPGHRRGARAAHVGGARALRGRASSARCWPTAVGARSVNRSGGLLSKGEPLGASALGQVVELVGQLRGTAGARQVDGRPRRPRPHHRPRRQRQRHHPHHADRAPQPVSA